MFSHTLYILIIVLLSPFLETYGFLQPPIDGYLRREFSLSKPYSSNGMSMPYWDFRDYVMISNNFLRLTLDSQAQRGSIWSKKPCTIHNWEMHVHYKIYGSGRTIAADGMAFWYTRTKMVPGPVFGSKDLFEGLGVFLDTYKNGNQPVSFPQVSAMIGNGSITYDHSNDGKENSIGSCLTSFRNKQHDTYMSIRYYNEKLTVSFDNNGENEWKKCLEIAGVKLPTYYFFGFSAATGDLSDNHEIIGLKFYELPSSTPENDEQVTDWSSVKPELDSSSRSKETSNSPESASMSGFKIFLITVAVVVGVGICAILAYLFFQQQQENNRKRFY